MTSDLAAIDETVAGLYAAISGPPGRPRDWDGLRSLMTENARMTPVGKDGAQVLDLDGYVARSEPFLVGEGFYEIETESRTEILGAVAQRRSDYEGRTGAPDGPIITTGTNSIQLIKQDGRWRVFSILWQAADMDVSKYAATTAIEE